MDSDSKKLEIKNNICTYLKQGMFKKDASRMAGISEDTYLRWYKEDADFADRVEASILEYKQSLIHNLTKNTEKNGLLALKVLQIRWAKEWGMSANSEERQEHETNIKQLVDKLDAIMEMEEDSNLNSPNFSFS